MTLGIWEKVEKDGRAVFVRDISRRPEWALWADVREIPVVKAGKRIVLAGESVARGSFYDPCYTVAQELQGILSRVQGMEDAEVVDLAKTGVFFPELQQLVTSCVVLDPDVVVIFGGNNLAFSINQGLWNFYELYEIYEKRGFAGVKAHFEELFRQRVVNFLEEVERLLTSRGIPVLFIIPEFNLRDWRSTANEQMVASLGDNKLLSWLEAKEAAAKAMSTHDLSRVEEAVAAMITIDPSNPLGYEWLGRHYDALGMREKARECFESARDTTFMNRGVISKPRCYRIIQQTIHTLASSHAIRVLDLPRVLEQEYGALPDRELFLDHCHLSLRGIKIAMRHAARLITEVLTGRLLVADVLPDSGVAPSNEVQAIAHFCAAIHNSHYGQAGDVVEYHCDRALWLYPGVSVYMLQFVDFSSRYASNPFCRSFGEMTVEGGTQQTRGIASLIPPRGRKLMDIELVDRIGESLRKTKKDFHLDIHGLRIREHGITALQKDLLESFYSTSFYDRPEMDNPPNFLEARIPETVFQFIAVTDELSFELVCRTPRRDIPDEPVEIYINDHPEAIVSIPARSKWSVYTFTIDGLHIRKGANKLAIRWPRSLMPEPLPEVRHARTAYNQVFPSLGEISAFTVTAVATAVVKPRIVQLKKIDQ
jgi:hypothetical protein